MDLSKGFPILEWLPAYDKKSFRSDLIAGITVAILLVPQAMAYAFLAGMPPIYGLYGGLLPLLIYAILGTSRQLSIGPVAIPALLLLAGVKQLADPGSEEFIQLVILAGLLAGILQVILSVLRLGFLVNYLSLPVISGFTSAAAVIIAVSQLKDLFGFPLPRFTYFYEPIINTVKNIGQTNWIALSMCLGAILLISILKKISKKIPGSLIMVILGTLISWKFDLPSYGLDIVGTVPEGLPQIKLPEFTFANIRQLMPTVFSITTIGLVGSLGIAKILEAQHQSYAIRPNQELLALGLAKIFGSFFQAFPSSGSFSRSAVNNESGAQTGMASIFTAVLIGLTLLFFTPLFYYLPKAILAAIILLSVKSLFNVKEAIHLWRTHRSDFSMMMITFLATLLFGIEPGVFTGVLLSLLLILYSSAKPHIAEIGNLPGTSYYRNLERFDDASPNEAFLIIRFDDQLFFANASTFKDHIKTLVNERGDKLKHFILDCSTIHAVDSSGAHALEEVFSFLDKKDISFSLCNVIGPVRDQLFRSGIIELLGQKRQFMKVHDAVQYALLGQGNREAIWTEDALQTNYEEE